MEYERLFYMNIIVSTILKNLVKNSLLSPFVFSQKSNKRIKFSASWKSGNKKYLSLSERNKIRTHNHLVHKRTLNHLARPAKLTTNESFPDICVMGNTPEISSKKSYIKKSNQICHQKITCSNSAPDNKNINSFRYCSVITADLKK